MAVVTGGDWPGALGVEGEPDVLKGQIKLYFFDIPDTADDGSWEPFYPNQLGSLATLLGQWKQEERRRDHCWAVLGIVKWVADTRVVLSAEDQSALDAWLPIAQSTLDCRQRDQPFKQGIPIVRVAVVPLPDEVELEVTGEIGAPAECNEEQTKLLLALEGGEMVAELLAQKLGISEEDLTALGKETDCVSSMLKAPQKAKGAKKKRCRKILVFELMGTALVLATFLKNRKTWVPSEHARIVWLASGSPGQMDRLNSTSLVVTPAWLDSLGRSERPYATGWGEPPGLDYVVGVGAVDVYCVVVRAGSNLSNLVQRTNVQLSIEQQVDFTTGKEVEDALVALGCGLAGDTLLSFVCREHHAAVYAHNCVCTGHHPAHSLLPHVVGGNTHDYVSDWLGMLRQISVDSERDFSALAQLVAVPDFARKVNDDYSDYSGPFCGHADYFFSMIFNDECPDFESLLAGRPTGYHWCAFFLSRRTWGTAVATIVDSLRGPTTMEEKYSQIINFLHELGVQQIDLVSLLEDDRQKGNSCGLQAANILAQVVNGGGAGPGDNGPGVGPLTGGSAAAATRRLDQLVHGNARLDRAAARKAADVAAGAAALDAVPSGSGERPGRLICFTTGENTGNCFVAALLTHTSGGPAIAPTKESISTLRTEAGLQGSGSTSDTDMVKLLRHWGYGCVMVQASHDTATILNATTNCTQCITVAKHGNGHVEPVVLGGTVQVRSLTEIVGMLRTCGVGVPLWEYWRANVQDGANFASGAILVEGAEAEQGSILVEGAEAEQGRACPTCTFIHKGHPDNCEMCGTQLAIVDLEALEGAAAEAQQVCPSCTFANAEHRDKCEKCGGHLLPPVLPTAPHAGWVALLVTKVRERLWIGQLPGGHCVEFGTGMDAVFESLWSHNMEAPSATRGPYPATEAAPDGTSLWVILSQDRRNLPRVGHRHIFYAELALQGHLTRREVERGQQNEDALDGLFLQNILASGTDCPRVGFPSPPTPMPVKYVAAIWESKQNQLPQDAAHRTGPQGDLLVQGGGAFQSSHQNGAVIGPNTIYSIMKHLQDPSLKPPPSGAPPKLFISLGQFCGKQVDEFHQWRSKEWRPVPDVVSVIDFDGGGMRCEQLARQLQSAWCAESLKKTVVFKVNRDRWEFDASSVGAKAQEGLTDGANLIFDVLFKNFNKTSTAPSGCSLQCSVTTSPPVDVESLVVKCTFDRTLTEEEMLNAGYGKNDLPAMEYIWVPLGIHLRRPFRAHFCPAIHKFFPNGPPEEMYVHVDQDFGAAGEAADESISTWGQGVAKEPGHRTWNCEACTFCNTMRGCTYAWLSARRAACPGCEPMFQCLACKCWQTFPRMLLMARVPNFDNAGQHAMLTPIDGDFGPVLCSICEELGPDARPPNYHEAHCHQLPMSGLGSNDCQRVKQCTFAFGQYGRLLGDNAGIVKQVDIWYNPAPQAKFLATKAEFTAAGKDTTTTWIFHGTPDPENVPKICRDGFLVGGQDGHPVQNGDVHGQVRLP